MEGSEVDLVNFGQVVCGIVVNFNIIYFVLGVELVVVFFVDGDQFVFISGFGYDYGGV